MANEERSSWESKQALDKVENSLKEARRLYSLEQPEIQDAKSHAESAREGCNEMAEYMFTRLSPLVNDAADAIEQEKPSGQVDVLVGNALAEVENIRPSLGSVEG